MIYKLKLILSKDNTSKVLLVLSFLFFSSAVLLTDNLYANDSTLVEREILSTKLKSIDLDNNDQQFDEQFSVCRFVLNEAKRKNYWDIYLKSLIAAQRICQEHMELDSLEKYMNIARGFLNTTQKKIYIKDVNIQNAQFTFNYNLAWFYFKSGDFRASRNQFLITLEELRNQTTIDSFSVFTIIDGIGKTYLQMGEYEQALNYFQESKNWLPYKATTNYRPRFRNYFLLLYQSRLGETYLTQNKELPSHFNDSLAYRHLKLVISSLESQDKASYVKSMLATNYRRISKIFISRKETDSALYYLDQTLELENPENPEVINTYQQFGKAHLLNKDYKKAMLYYQKSYEILKKTYPHKNYRVASVLLDMGNLHKAKLDISTALKYYQKALVEVAPNFFDSSHVAKNPNIFQEQGIYEQVLLDLLVSKAKALGSIYLKNGQQSQLLTALRTYKLAALLVQRMQVSFQDIESKLFLAEQSQSIFQGAIHLAYEAYRRGIEEVQPIEEIYYYMERNKSSLLRESFQGAQAQNYINLPDSLLQQEASIKRKRYLLKEKLRDAQENPEENQERIAKLKKQLFDLQQRQEKLQTYLQTEYPEYYNLKFGSPLLSLQETQEKIRSKNSVLVEYFFGPDQLYILGISGKRVVLDKIPLDQKLLEVLARFVTKDKSGYYFNYDTIRNADEAFHQQFTRDAHFLYEKLLVSILAKSGPSGQNKLIIVPDGLLSYLPFDVLLTQAAQLEGPNYAPLPFLIKKYVIQYGYSATLLFKNTPQDQIARHHMLSYCGFAPLYGDSRQNPSRSRRPRAWNPREKVSYLHHNKEEVAFAQEVMGGQGFYDRQATKQNFLAYADKARIIHLSMHAFVDEREAHSAGLLFAKDSNTYEFLSLYELYGINLHADLAVLSACETGQGQYVQGAGVLSLGHTFRYAGCSSIVMSHWPADDETAFNLMRQYFWYLKQGKNKDEALQAAKLDFLNQAGSLSHPYFWANFVFIGDEEAIQLANSSNKWVWYGLGAILLLGLWVFRKQVYQSFLS